MAAHNSAEALSKAIEKLGGVDHQVILADQSEDVLDTWFSSAILPFANHGWPENVCTNILPVEKRCYLIVFLAD